MGNKVIRKAFAIARSIEKKAAKQVAPVVTEPVATGVLPGSTQRLESMPLSLTLRFARADTLNAVCEDAYKCVGVHGAKRMWEKRFGERPQRVRVHNNCWAVTVEGWTHHLQPLNGLMQEVIKFDIIGSKYGIAAARLGVDTKTNFKLKYVDSRATRKNVKRNRKLDNEQRKVRRKRRGELLGHPDPQKRTAGLVLDEMLVKETEQKLREQGIIK